MTKNCLKSISADALTGAIFAFEGMDRTITLLNGPMGCRFYHSTTSEHLRPRPLLYLPTETGGERVPVDYNYLNDWFFRQERVPCTYLDGEDYIYGTEEKVTAAIAFIRENIDFDLLAIVNSPGAALIGDDLFAMARAQLGDRPVVAMETHTFSDTFEAGYAEASRELLIQVGAALWNKRAPLSGGSRPRVNLLGLSVWQRYCAGDIAELKRLFALCGIDVHTCLCAECSLKELENLADAALNVVIDPEMGLAVAAYLEEALSLPYYVCPTLPLGFAAVERIFKEICEQLGVSSAAVQRESECARALAWYKLRQVEQMSGKPKGVKFHVSGNPAQERAYTAFLSEYLALSPTPAGNAELVFANANVISELMLENKTFCGIEIGLPGMGYIDLLPKTHWGINGALFLIEQVLNGMMTQLS